MKQDSAPYEKPLPLMSGFAKEFYDHCRNGELRFQRCDDCGRWRHVPRRTCAHCGSWNWQWARSNGRGSVFSWTVVRRPMHPNFVSDVPYAPAIVEMEEGVRIVSWVTDCPPDELRRGMRVEVHCEAVTPELSLPRFHRMQAGV